VTPQQCKDTAEVAEGDGGPLDRGNSEVAAAEAAFALKSLVCLKEVNRKEISNGNSRFCTSRQAPATH